jgi:hypothetical protein
MDRSRMRTIVLMILIIVVSSGHARAGENADGPGGVAWGITAGSPQLIGLTLETHQNRSLRLQGSVGTVILASSLTGRVVLTHISGKVRPFVFAGGGLFNVGEGDGGGARGTTGFVWGGGGLAVPMRSIRLFAELGMMGAMDRDKGYESPLPTVAMGILFVR